MAGRNAGRYQDLSDLRHPVRLRACDPVPSSRRRTWTPIPAADACVDGSRGVAWSAVLFGRHPGDLCGGRSGGVPAARHTNGNVASHRSVDLWHRCSPLADRRGSRCDRPHPVKPRHEHRFRLSVRFLLRRRGGQLLAVGLHTWLSRSPAGPGGGRFLLHRHRSGSNRLAP